MFLQMKYARAIVYSAKIRLLLQRRMDMEVWLSERGNVFAGNGFIWYK
jgi:hypothetical protein